MRSYFVFVCLIFIPIFSGCKSKPESIKFTGITQMDKFGTIEGTPDTTDWGSKDIWTAREKALFADSFSTNCKAVNFRAMFYPNPCRKKSTLYLLKDSTVRVAIRLVDKDLNVIMSNDSVYKSAMEFDLSSFKTDDTIRLYYKFITKDKCEYRGHGDISVNPYK
ncbi:MAG TPA: hypothetical protein VIH57_05970 [Bacteroidales bacterium]